MLFPSNISSHLGHSLTKPFEQSYANNQNIKYNNQIWNDNTIMNTTVIVNDDNKSSSLVESTEMLFITIFTNKNH